MDRIKLNDIQPLSLEDLKFVLEVRNHISTRKWLKNNTKFTLEQTSNWFTSTNPNWFILLSRDVKDKRLGYIRTTIDGEIGCDIHPDYRRQGLATKALSYMLDKKKFATLWVFEDNPAKKMYYRLGFKDTGNKTFIRDKKYVQMMYSAL